MAATVSSICVGMRGVVSSTVASLKWVSVDVLTNQSDYSLMVPRRGLPDPMYGSARPADQPPFCCFVPRGLKNASIGVDIEPIPIGESSSAPRCARSDRRSGPVGSCARRLRGQHPPQSLGARYRHVVEQLANGAGLAVAYLGLGRRGFGV